ncbi:hypothetical protein [Marinactinospora rubrisoli]|uniref:Uncharacterized protein n=1 Tax=Marinactinospora rubrisoli TaxID=2715399 RepID=A0ABW2KE40_9ACTN
MTVAYSGEGIGSPRGASASAGTLGRGTGVVVSGTNGFGDAAGPVTPVVLGHTVPATASSGGAPRSVGTRGLPAVAAPVTRGTIRRTRFRES